MFLITYGYKFRYDSPIELTVYNKVFKTFHEASNYLIKEIIPKDYWYSDLLKAIREEKRNFYTKYEECYYIEYGWGKGNKKYPKTIYTNCSGSNEYCGDTWTIIRINE